MPLWRIRVILPGDPHSHQAFRDVIAAYPSDRVRVESVRVDAAEMTGDVVVELPDDEPLGELLHTLHDISPQVFVSRANPPQSSQARQAPRVRQISRRLGSYSS